MSLQRSSFTEKFSTLIWCVSQNSLFYYKTGGKKIEKNVANLVSGACKISASTIPRLSISISQSGDISIKWLSNVLSFAQTKIYISYEINKSRWLKNIMNKITKEIKQACHEMQTCLQFKYCCSNTSWQCTLTYFQWENEAAAYKMSSDFKEFFSFIFPEF